MLRKTCVVLAALSIGLSIGCLTGCSREKIDLDKINKPQKPDQAEQILREKQKQNRGDPK